MPGSADATGLRGRGVEGERRPGRRAAVARWLRVAAWGLLPILVVFLLTACTSNDPQDTLDVRSDFNQKIFNLYALVFWMAAGVFIVVEGILLYSLIRFRRRPGDGLPPQIHGNNKLEIVWTVIPVILLIIVAVPTLKTIIETERVPAPGPNVVQIHVTGHQWWWEVQYPDYKITTANDIVVPEGKVASFTLTSGDVQHSFWIPKMGGKMDVLPTRTNHMSFTPQDIGEYWGQCVELCGTSHANMRTRLIVMKQADFDNWVKQQQAAPAQPTTDQEKAGEQLFMRSACIGCHTINGTNAKGVAGPNLTHVGSRDVIAAGVLQNTPENMAKWISDPAAIKPGINPDDRKGYFMPAFKDQLTPDQIDQIVAYLQSLK